MAGLESRARGTIVQIEEDKGKPRGRCRKWQLRVFCGVDGRTGKKRTKTRRFHGTYTEAQRALKEFVKEIDGGEVKAVARAGMTFEERCADFMEQRRASGEFSANRLRKQEATYRAACAHIGKCDFAKVTPAMLDRMYRAMQQGDTLSGRPASGTYVHAIHTEIGLLYRESVKDGIVSENPCDRAHPPRVDSEPRRAMPPQQVREMVSLLNVTEERDFAYWLAIGLGLRRGEVCGLSWGDVDLAGMVVNVRHSFDSFRNLKGTKTGAGRRALPLTDEQAGAFREHRAAQEARGVEVTAETPVIVTGRDSRVNPDVLGRWWTEDREALGAGGYCLHELRHSYLSMLAIAGVHPKVMQELAGHSSCEITMDIYTHVNLEAKREAAEAMRELMAG